jgi:hypothetical protein
MGSRQSSPANHPKNEIKITSQFVPGGKMKPKFWLLAGAIMVCGYLGGQLVWETELSDTHFQAEEIRKKAPAMADGLPAAAVKGVQPKSFALKPNRGTAGPSMKIAPDVTEREELTPAGLPIGDPEYPDHAEVESRLLTEQLAESFRNPAYLQAIDEEPSEGIETDTLDDTEAEVLEEEEFADDQSEQESNEEVTLNDEEVDEFQAEDERSFMRPQLTEAGVEISEHGYLDPEEVEKRLLDEQLAESLRNPAYLESSPDEEILEETSEED